MAYTPITQPKKAGGYVPIGTKAQPTKDLQGFFPTLNKVRAISTPPLTPQPKTIAERNAETKRLTGSVPFAATKTGITVNTVRGLPKAAAGVAKEIVQGTARGAATTGGYLGARAVGQTPEQARNATFTPDTRLEKVIFGSKPFNVQTEAVEPLQSLGVSKNIAEKIGAPALIGLTAADLFTGGGKRKLLEEAVVQANNLTDANKVLRNAQISEIVIKNLKLDERVVAAKTPAQAKQIIDDAAKEVVKEVAPLPKLQPTKIKTTPTITPVATKVDNVTTAPARIEPKIPAALARETPEFVTPPTVVKLTPKTVESTRRWISNFNRREMTPNVLNELNLAKIVPQEPITLYRVGDVDNTYFQSWSKIKPGIGQFTEKKFTPDEILLDTTDERFLSQVPDTGIEGVKKLGSLKSEVIIKPVSMVGKTAPAIKPELPPLPKLPPEMAQKLRVQQADETISRAILDRYKTAAKKPAIVDSKVVAEAKQAGQPGTTKKFFGELLTPISSRLRRINPDFEVQMRKMEFRVNQNTAKSMEAIRPVLEGSAKMKPIDRQLFSLSRLNGDREVYEALAEKYGIKDALLKSEAALDDILTRGNEVGMNIPKRENYNPRIIKNPKEYLNYWRGQDDWGDINRLIEEEAKKKNISYTDLMKDPEKVASIINNYIRGYGSKTVLAAPSATKKRTIAVLDEELAEFYEDADTALATYMIRMNDEIEGRKFFGKKADGDADIQDSIGAHVMDLVVNNKIKPQQQEEVADILRARFHRGKMAGALDLYRNAEYISTMGNPISAITQIGDFAWSLYDNGFWRTAKAAVGKKKITREALGLDASIMNEYTNGTLGGKAVEKTFKLVGLDKMARLGQETMVNAQFGKYQKMARQNDDIIRAEMDRLFDSDEAALALKEFANGDITERTKFVVFNRLLDFQPLTKSEMPQVYLEHPNGRIFYMLKSFTLKQYDIFRREAFDKIATGEPTQMKQGTKNLIAIAGLFMMANATADELKDLLLGRETPPSDRLIDNLWRLVGASKYDVYKAREDGIGTTVLRKILFPASIWDRASKDFETVVTDKEYERGPLAGEDYKFESTQTIPVGGKLYYWWFGRGAQKEEYKEETTTETEAAELPTLPELPKLPKLPKI